MAGGKKQVSPAVAVIVIVILIIVIGVVYYTMTGKKKGSMEEIPPFAQKGGMKAPVLQPGPGGPVATPSSKGGGQ